MLSSRRALVGYVIALSVTLLPAESASACSCAPNSFAAQTQSYDEIMRVRIRGGGIELFGETWYRGRVQRTFNGCTKRGQWVLIRTPTSSAACGVTLTANMTYLVFASQGDPLFGSPTFTIGACAMHTPWSSLSSLQRQTLLGVYGCCGDTCICADGSPPVACFANPCDTVSCTSASTCTPNYCGGCKAEFLNAQGEVTCSSCEGDGDCPSGQLCTPQGVCDSGCVVDADCPDDAWCRPVEDVVAPSQCTPYQQLDQPCGGFTPYWAATQCLPGLTCLGDPAIPDLPGTCESPCTVTADCATSSYCAGAKVCLADGECQNASDCDADGNDYPAPSCAGYATCSSTGACGWQCNGVPGCDDLSGQNFGPCAGILGWGVVSGVCAQVSGCSSGDTLLFDSLTQCMLTCEVGGLPF